MDAEADIINGMIQAASTYRELKGLKMDATPEQITTGTTIALGASGGALSLIFGGRTFTWPQKIGVVASGSILAFVACPLIKVVWPAAPDQLFGITGVFCGLIGLNVVRGVLAWGNRAEKSVPDRIDRTIGTDTKENKG